MRFVSPLPPCCLSFFTLIAVYRVRVITCEIGRVIFLPKVWILSRPIAGFIAPSLRWLNLNGWMERRSTGSGERERGWQRGLTWALNHAPRNPPSTGSWQQRCHHGQATSYASWQHWSRISQSIRCKLALFKDDNEHQDTCRCHWRDAIMIGCPSHRAPLGLMVFRPGMGGRRGGTRNGQGESFLLWSVCSIWCLCMLLFCRTLAQTATTVIRPLSSQSIFPSDSNIWHHLSNLLKQLQCLVWNTANQILLYVFYCFVSHCHRQ